MNVSDAARCGDERSLLVSLRDRVADAIADPNCSMRDLASLTLRLQQIVRDLKALDSEEGDDDLGAAMRTPDAPFDPSSI